MLYYCKTLFCTGKRLRFLPSVQVSYRSTCSLRITCKRGGGGGQGNMYNYLHVYAIEMSIFSDPPKLERFLCVSMDTKNVRTVQI